MVRNLNSVEHPLTTSSYYILLYESAPFLGIFVGLSAVSFNQPLLSQFTIVVQGTLIMTIVMWIIADPLIGLIEAAFPQSVAHRKQRLVKIQAKKRKQILESQKLLREISQQEAQTESKWTFLFRPYAAEIVDLLYHSSVSLEFNQRRITELGALAWREGGILCMKFFHKIILDEIKSRTGCCSIDFVTLYWDGIGTWRKPSEIGRMYI